MEQFQHEGEMKSRVLCYGATAKGSIHDKNGKPMQDRSIQRFFGDNNEKLIIAVSDGHGSDPYFRSDTGAQLAIDIATRLVENFVLEFEYEASWPNFVQRGTEMDRSNKDPYAEPQFRHLFEMIIAEWREAVENDLSENPLTDEEYINASAKRDNSVKDLYENQGAAKLNIYGCTLIVAVRAQDYWFAFRIGDGTCEALDKDNNWFSPLPWDAQCESNVTTSLCEYGSESFTYCYGRIIPTAMFIASDGIDDNFGGVHDGVTPIEQIEWFRNLLMEIHRHNLDFPETNIEQKLNSLRHYDDKSLRLWIDTSSMLHIFDGVTKQSIAYNEQKLKECKAYVDKKEKEIENLEYEISILEENNKADELYVNTLEAENNHIVDKKSLVDSIIENLNTSIECVTGIVDKFTEKRAEHQREIDEGEKQARQNLEDIQVSQKRIKAVTSDIFVKQTMLKSYRRELDEVYRPMLSQIEQRIKELKE